MAPRGRNPGYRTKDRDPPPVSPHLSGRCSSCWNCSAEPAAATAPAMARLREGHVVSPPGHVGPRRVTCVRSRPRASSPRHVRPPLSRVRPASRARPCPLSRVPAVSLVPRATRPVPRAGTRPVGRDAPGHTRPGLPMRQMPNTPENADPGCSAFANM